MSGAISIKKPIGAAGRALRILALLALVALATPAGAALGFGANFSHTTIDEGKAGLEIYLSAFNTGAAGDVDVYLVARTPSGDFYSFRNGDWVRGIAPWLAGFALPADFSLVGSRVTVLPALGAGLYTLYTGLARPGTLDLLYLGEAPFLVVRGGSKGVRLGSLRLSTFNTTGLAGVGTYSEVRGRFIGSDGTLDATRRVLDGIEPALDRCVFNERPLNPFDGAGDLVPVRNVPGTFNCIVSGVDEDGANAFAAVGEGVLSGFIYGIEGLSDVRTRWIPTVHQSCKESIHLCPFIPGII